MRILVTGGSGYIGSHLKHLFENNGHKVVVFDLKEEYDLKIKENIINIFETNDKIDAVVHLAAKISVPESEIIPVDYYENNSATIITLMDVMDKFKCRNLIFSSTAAVYDFDDKNDNNLKETSPINPHSIYGHSKLVAENILERLSKKLNINYVIFRFFNVAGTNDFVQMPDRHPHLLPVIMEKYSNHEKLEIFGNDYNTPDGTCVRDYVHVDDICSAINMALLKLSSCDKYSNVINLGTSSGYSVKEVIDIFNKTMDFSNQNHLECVYESRRSGDPGSLIANYERATNELGWYPKHSLEDTITSTMKYW